MMSTSTLEKPKCKPDLKLVIVGEKAVGKTSLVHRYLEKRFLRVKHTIGAAFSLKNWNGYNIAIWDTAGEERYLGLTSFYFHGARAALLVYDPSDENTFKLLRDRFIPLLDNAEENCLKVIVGTKLDLLSPEKRKVSMEEGRNLAKKLNPTIDKEVPYFETSSLLGLNVDETFQFIFEEIFYHGPKRENYTKNIFEDSINLQDHKRGIVNPQGKKCC